MLRKIALVTITAAALVAPPSLVHAGVQLTNGVSENGVQLQNGVSVNGSYVNGVEPAGREVYFVGEQAGGASSTVLTIELPQGHVAR
jgi:hypothetical protein